MEVQGQTQGAAPTAPATTVNEGGLNPALGINDPAPEAPKPEAKPESPKEDIDFAKRFGAISRKERELWQRERSLKELEERLMKQKETPSNTVSWEEVSKNPLLFFEKSGKSVQDLLTLVANDGKPSTDMTVRALQEEINNLKKEAEERRRNEEEARKKDEEGKKLNARQQQIKEFKDQIKEFAESRPDDFDLIRSNGTDGIDLVYNVIEEHYVATDGLELMPFDQACKAVEEYLEGQAKQRYSQSKKFKAMFGIAPTTQTEQGTKSPDSPPPRESPTLSNRNLAAPPSPTNDRYVSVEESKRRAAEFLKQALAAKRP